MSHKRQSIVLAISVCALSIVSGCGNRTGSAGTMSAVSSNSVYETGTEEVPDSARQEDAKDASAPDALVAEAAESGVSEAIEEDDSELTDNSADVVLPAYQYPGTDPFYKEIFRYVVEEMGQHYEPADVSIPCPVIVDIDESNPDDICVWGEFWIYQYELQDDTLKMVSGGNFPGQMHLMKSGASYEVTGMDYVADGSDSEVSAEEIFGDRYEAYTALSSFLDVRESARKQIIDDYVVLNQLPISQYQDEGWIPVSLSQKTPTLASPSAAGFQDTDGTGQTWTFSCGGETFTAQYTENNWKIIDSYKIRNFGDMMQICEALQEIHEIPGLNGEARTPLDMAYEWLQHNFVYDNLPEDHEWRQLTADVDLNPNDQGKTYAELYEDRMETRYRFIDLWEKMKGYLLDSINEYQP